MADVEHGWVLFDLKSQQFGLPIRDLLQMVVLKDVVKVARVSPDVRGVISLRGSVIQVIDLRMRLGIVGMHQEWQSVFDLMEARKKDHINWIAALETSVVEGKEFTLARDPHKCAFGRWYDNFKTPNNLFALYLEKFDAPHKRIHALADKVAAMIVAGQNSAAQSLIATSRRTELAAMIRLFDKTRSVASETVNEIVMVVQQPTGKVGIIVDSVTAVKDIDPTSIENPLSGQGIVGGSFIKGIVHMDGGTKILLDQSQLLGTCELAAYH